jgi:hypothetical protein
MGACQDDNAPHMGLSNQAFYIFPIKDIFHGHTIGLGFSNDFQKTLIDGLQAPGQEDMFVEADLAIHHIKKTPPMLFHDCITRLATAGINS